MKASSIKEHLNSEKHQKNKVKAAADVVKQKLIADSFKAYTDTNEGSRLPSGSTLEEQTTFRIQVLTAFLASGTPLNRLRYFKPLLERARGSSINDPRHLGLCHHLTFHFLFDNTFQTIAVPAKMQPN